jgi:hypothetical protein
MYKTVKATKKMNGHRVTRYAPTQNDYRHLVVLSAPSEEYGVIYTLRAVKFGTEWEAVNAYNKAIGWMGNRNPAEWQVKRNEVN